MPTSNVILRTRAHVRAHNAASVNFARSAFTFSIPSFFTDFSESSERERERELLILLGRANRPPNISTCDRGFLFRTMCVSRTEEVERERERKKPEDSSRISLVFRENANYFCKKKKKKKERKKNVESSMYRIGRDETCRVQHVAGP